MHADAELEHGSHRNAFSAVPAMPNTRPIHSYTSQVMNDHAGLTEPSMSETEFRTKRRQKFLTQKYFDLNNRSITRSIQNNGIAMADLLAAMDFDPSSHASAFKNRLKLLRLHYTAGAPIETLRPMYAEVMKWFEAWHKAEDAYSAHLAKKSGEDLRLDMTPVEFGDLFHYQLALDVVSLGILLGEADAVRRAAALMQSAHHTDLLFESLLAKVIADPDDTTTEFFHEQPYDPLIDAFYTAETPADASAFVKRYLDGWYQAFEGVPWHDGHLVQTEEYSNYEGYWTFEAAAICVLYDIDDSSFRDHLVYPKDLADWARANEVTKRLAPAAGAQALRLRCEGGQPCPQAGFWSTPAQTNSRRRFAANELMPTVEGSSWGATIWYWDDAQG